jgi:PAS domain S-box-containing protein
VRGKITGYDTENNKGRFAGAVTDITKRKVSEQKLLESENFNRNLVASLPDYLLVYDAQGTILYVNDSAVRAMRSVPAEIIGRNFLDFIVPEMRPFVLHQSQKRSRGEVVDPYEVRIMRRDGSFIDAVIHVAPILYQGRQAVLAVVTDITERRHSEENLARYAVDIERYGDALALANRKLNLLSHMTRHDILNQVHIVLSYLSLLRSICLIRSRNRFSRRSLELLGLFSGISNLQDSIKILVSIPQDGKIWGIS